MVFFKKNPEDQQYALVKEEHIFKGQIRVYQQWESEKIF